MFGRRPCADSTLPTSPTAAAFAYSHATAFPGYAALVPTLGTVLVIGAGLEQTSSRFSVGRVLSLKPFRYIGDRSYALYLWHWPFLILGALYVGHALGLLTRLLLVFASFLVAILTYRFFENPIRHMRSRPLSALLWPASIGAVVLVAALALGSISTAADRFQASGTPAQPVGLRHTPSGGRSLAAQGVSGGSLPEVISTVEAARRGAGIPGGLVPRVDKLGSSHYSYPPGCEPRNGETSSRVCRLGRPSAKRSIAVIGDSHLRVWMPAILQMAARDGWVVRPFTKPSCLPWRWKKPDAKNPECRAWINWAVRRARALHPTVTLVGGAFAPLPHSPGDGGQTTVDAIKSVTAALKPFSKRVVVLGDVPYQTRGIVDCLLSSGASLMRCSAAPTRPQLYEYVAAQARFEGAGFIDVRPWFCYQDLCPMVIGHTIAYWNTTHMSMAYALKLVAPFRAAFRAAIA